MIQKTLLSSTIRRCHTLRHHQHYDIAGHVMRMLYMLDWVYEGEPPIDLVRCVMYHDTVEVETGDIPAPIKRHPFFAETFRTVDEYYHDEYNLPSTDDPILKVLDSLEFMWFCKSELDMGNQLILPCFNRSKEYYKQAINTLSEDMRKCVEVMRKELQL